MRNGCLGLVLKTETLSNAPHFSLDFLNMAQADFPNLASSPDNLDILQVLSLVLQSQRQKLVSELFEYSKRLRHF